jgi:hypothetical protein
MYSILKIIIGLKLLLIFLILSTGAVEKSETNPSARNTENINPKLVTWMESSAILPTSARDDDIEKFSQPASNCATANSLGELGLYIEL